MPSRGTLGSSVLVTGGAGFIGANLIRRLLEGDPAGHWRPARKVIAFDSFRWGTARNLAEFSSEPRFEIVEGDIRNRGEVEAVVGGLDCVFHLSSIVGIEHYCEDPLEVIDVNVLGTRNTLESVLKRGVRMVFASTSEIFGKNPKVPWREDDDRVLGSTRVDRWSYSTSKAVCEHMIFALIRRRGLQCSIVRFFNVYGPKQNPIFVVSKGVHRVLRNQPPLVYDSGAQNRCFTYVDDAVQGMILAAEHESAIGEAFNIGSSVPTSIREVNEVIIEEAGRKGQMEPEPLDPTRRYGDRYEDIPRRIPDVSKAARVLGWTAGTPLRKGVRQFIDWAESNRWWLGEER